MAPRVDVDAAMLMNPTDMCDEVVCDICCGLLLNRPLSCPEGHTFCGSCWEEHAKHSSRCPTCRQEVVVENLVRNRPIENIVSSFRVKCKHRCGNECAAADPPAAKRLRRNDGKVADFKSLKVAELRQMCSAHNLPCGLKSDMIAALQERSKTCPPCLWTGKLGDFERHLSTDCPNQLVVCCHTGCSFSTIRCQFESHIGECPFLPVKCRHCNQNVPRKEHTEHEGSCLATLIECPNGCGETIRRGQRDQHFESCPYHQIVCPCHGCDHEMLRHELPIHLKKSALFHAEAANSHIKVLDAQIKDQELTIKTLEGKVATPTLIFKLVAYEGPYSGDEVEIPLWIDHNREPVEEDGFPVSRLDFHEASCSVGRSSQCEVRLTKDETVSRFHAKFELKGGILSVSDIGSTFGTHVNGEKIQDPETVSPGDCIQIGKDSAFELKLEARV